MCVPVPAACRHAFVGVVLSRACACRTSVNGVSTVAEAVGDHECCIKATSGGRKKSGIVHYLLLDGETMPAL